MRLDPPTRKTIRLDTVSPTLMYVGAGPVGLSESAPAWAIRKITTTGTVLAVEWADGDDNYDNVWTDRASLSYS